MAGSLPKHKRFLSTRMQKEVLEYPLPATTQTHEVVPVTNDLLLISQQECNSVVKVALDPSTGRPKSAARFLIGNCRYRGLHGLCVSTVYPEHVWATLQFDSAIILLNPHSRNVEAPPSIVQGFRLPAPVSGPHCIIEDGPNLWMSCKDSGHVVRVRPDVSNGDIDIDNLPLPSDISIYQCSRRPIFVAVARSGYVYASLDMSSKIFCLDQRTQKTSEIDIPADKGSSPVGLVAGPDGHAWFVLLGDASGGSGAFGRISGEGEITWFHLTSAAGSSSGLIHLAFDRTYSLLHEGGLRMWLLGSSIGSTNCIDAIFTVNLEAKPNLKIVKQDVIMLATPYSKAHRVLPHNDGLFVTELGVSTLAHISGTATRNEADNSDAYSFWGAGEYADKLRYDGPSTMATKAEEEGVVHPKRQRPA